ncbi:hypothetical protein NP493_55g02008 [Ridgeia piscesae]|uniref:Bactericidal permeability-increasing protein n=1 Tax=Ridgeia piscesae TaxID=27915 RepID=A0AAD9UIY1_RIDPI|nr:hypothetical protein NP493_55g02008 [Ridgeia piscesae]
MSVPWGVVAFATVLAFGTAAGSGTRPGFRTRITQRGLDYARDVGLDIVSKEIKQLKIPDVSAQSGGAKAKLYDIKFVKQPEPTASVVPLHELGLRLAVANINAELSAKYGADIKMSFFKMKSTGTIRVVTENMKLVLDTHIGRDNAGRPSLYKFFCKGSGVIRVTFKGGWSNLLNLGSKVFQSKIRSVIIAQICTNTIKEIKRQIDLHVIPVRETVAEDYELDFSMVRFPKFEPTHVELYSKGEINIKDRHIRMPFSPPEIPLFHQHNKKMAYVYVTDYLLNSGFMAAFKNQQLSGYVNESLLPAQVKDFMKTTCPMSLCLGSLLPNIGKRYPGAASSIHIYATQSPTVHVRGASIGLAGWGVVNITVTDKDGKEQPVMSATLSGTANFTVHVSNSRVFFNIVKLTPKVTVVKSAVDDNGLGAILEPVLKIASEGLLLPRLTDLGFEGIPLPKVKDLRFVDTEILPDKTEHVVIVGTDIRLEPYDPDAEDEIKKTLEMFQSLPKISMSSSPIFADVEGSSA